jgi:hypothetical protein
LNCREAVGYALLGIAPVAAIESPNNWEKTH